MLKPRNDYLIVKIEKIGEMSAGGVFVPDSARKDTSKIQRGTVVSSGPGRLNQEGRLVPTTVKAGDRVLMNWGGLDIMLEKEPHRIIREEDILAVDE